MPRGREPSAKMLAPMLTPRRVAITVVLAAALFGIAYAASAGTGVEDRAPVLTAVEDRFPPQDSIALQQDAVGVDLAPGWTGRLIIGGVEIPPDQTNCFDCPAPESGPDPLNRVFFRPGPGKAYEVFPTGRLCATAVIWPETLGPEQSQQIDWCFRVGA